MYRPRTDWIFSVWIHITGRREQIVYLFRSINTVTNYDFLVISEIAFKIHVFLVARTVFSNVCDVKYFRCWCYEGRVDLQEDTSVLEKHSASVIRATSALKMEAVCSSSKLVSACDAALLPRETTSTLQRRENLDRAVEC
jgi:hypothetical protein